MKYGINALSGVTGRAISKQGAKDIRISCLHVDIDEVRYDVMVACRSERKYGGETVEGDSQGKSDGGVDRVPIRFRSGLVPVSSLGRDTGSSK